MEEIKNVINNGIKINIIGDINKLPNNLKKILNTTVEKTKKNKKITVNLALNYGSRDEIAKAFKELKKKKKFLKQI